MQRLPIRLFLILTALILVALPLSEQRQTATVRSGSDRSNEPFCGAIALPTRNRVPQTAHPAVSAIEPRIVAGLFWKSVFHTDAFSLGGEHSHATENSNNRVPLIVGLPEETTPPPLRSLLGLAQIANVNVNDNFFSPQTVRISAGDTVRWTWVGNTHDVTSGTCCESDGSFSSPVANAGFTFSHPFNTPGTFQYFCTVHGSVMTGTVIVDPATVSPTIQFSATIVSVTETLDATTKIDLTVTRSGDAAGSASVNYASSDGSATERSDYLTTVGTLRFDPNQTSKLITVFIVDDRFGESAETFNVTLSNPVGATLGSPATLTVTINSDESVNGPNPVKDASFNTDFFVRQHYVDFFNREADAPGLGFWKNQIDECTEQACREIRRINVSAAFFVSIEFQQTGYLVYKTYQAAYNSGEFLKLRDFLPDLQEIGRGVVVGQPGADLQLEANKQRFFADFVQRATFLDAAAYPITLTATQFVDRLNANTYDPRNPSGGSLTQTQRDALVAQLEANPASASLRAQVVRSIAENGVFDSRQFNKAFVLMQYFGYLRRNPNDPPELNLDFSGFNFWLGKLNQFNGNFVEAEMVKAFITSGEYAQRFGP